MTNQAVRGGSRNRVRWVAPVAVLGVALAVPTLVQATAKADPTLPTISAQKLAEEVIAAKPVALQGEISQSMDIGIPSVPGGVQKPSTLDLTNLVQGTHTWRVWYDGARSSRVALVDGTSEAAIITNPTDTWVWSSLDRTAVHSKTPAAGSAESKSKAGSGADLTPAEAAKKLLSTADKSTTVTVAGTTTVAGRAAYDLTLTPKDGTTLVKRVSIAIDAITKQPLRVQVFSIRQSAPAVNIGFTSISFTTPDASVFTFTAPPGTKVTQKSDDKAGVGKAGAPGQTKPAKGKAGAPGQTGKTPGKSGSTTSSAQKPVVTGTGWGTVVVANGIGDLTGAPSELAGLLNNMPKVSGTWGSGRIFQGTLFTVVITDQGKVAAGAVPAEKLYAALS